MIRWLPGSGEDSKVGEPSVIIPAGLIILPRGTCQLRLLAWSIWDAVHTYDGKNGRAVSGLYRFSS